MSALPSWWCAAPAVPCRQKNAPAGREPHPGGEVPSSPERASRRRERDQGGGQLTGPTPGMVISRRASGLALALASIWRSSAVICAVSASRLSAATSRTDRACSGTSLDGLRTSSTRRATCAGPLRRYGRSLARTPAQGVDDLGPRPDQQIVVRRWTPAACASALFGATHPHGRPLRGLVDRFGIGGIVLLPLHERLHIGRRDQANPMPKRADLGAQRRALSTPRSRPGRRGCLPRTNDLVVPQLLAEELLRPTHPCGVFGESTSPDQDEW